MDKRKNAKFSTQWGFILAAVGSAVGMANVWGFPAKMGANGGSAFLVAYLFFVALFGVVGLAAEGSVRSDSLMLFLKTGFCGGFTTFSTFSLRLFQLLQFLQSSSRFSLRVSLHRQNLGFRQ